MRNECGGGGRVWLNVTVLQVANGVGVTLQGVLGGLSYPICHMRVFDVDLSFCWVLFSRACYMPWVGGRQSC